MQKKPTEHLNEYLVVQGLKSTSQRDKILDIFVKAGRHLSAEELYARVKKSHPGKYLLYMAAFKDHVSIYPATASMMAKYGEQLRPHRSGAGTLRFELGDRLPLQLITKLAKLRVQERRAPATLRRTRSGPRGKSKG